MNRHEALLTIIQQQRKFINQLISFIDTTNNKFNDINNEINNIDNEIDNINKTNQKDNEQIIELTNNINNINTNLNSILANNGNLTDNINLLKTLGNNYNSIISLANTLKNFLEDKDVVDETINTWTEIKDFLDGIEDSESLIAILNDLTSDIDNVRNDLSEYKIKNTLPNSGLSIDEYGNIGFTDKFNDNNFNTNTINANILKDKTITQEKLSTDIVDILTDTTPKDSIIKTTYEDLIAAKNNNELIPGAKYRFTYSYSTSESYGKSAEHDFDLILTATSNNTLSEQAEAIQTEGDTYFANSNLKAWKIWYDINNNTTRYSWADENGKGVIYRMIDEFNNDVNHDFKNYLWKCVRTTLKSDSKYKGTSANNLYAPIGLSNDFTQDYSDFIYCYLFNGTDNIDNSLSGKAYNNIIHYYNSNKMYSNITGVIHGTINNCNFICPHIFVCKDINHVILNTSSQFIILNSYNIDTKYYCNGFNIIDSNNITISYSNSNKIYKSKFIILLHSNNNQYIYNSNFITMGSASSNNQIYDSRAIVFKDNCNNNTINNSKYISFGFLDSNNIIINGNYINIKDNSNNNYITSAYYVNLGSQCNTNSIIPTSVQYPYYYTINDYISHCSIEGASSNINISGVIANIISINNSYNIKIDLLNNDVTSLNIENCDNINYKGTYIKQLKNCHNLYTDYNITGYASNNIDSIINVRDVRCIGKTTFGNANSTNIDTTSSGEITEVTIHNGGIFSINNTYFVKNMEVLSNAKILSNDILNIIYNNENRIYWGYGIPVKVSANEEGTTWWYDVKPTTTWTGTQAQYDAITTKDANTVYYITE